MSISMSNFLPPATGDTLGSLLQVLGDPKEAKKAIERMAEERQAIEEATEKQREQYERLKAAAEKTQAENERAKAETEERITKAAIQLGVAKRILAEAESRKEEMVQAQKKTVALRVVLDEREEKLGRRETDLEAQLLRAREREDQLDIYAKQLAAREKALADGQKALAEDIAENEKWLAALKPPRGR
jgi:hypothetical protein